MSTVELPPAATAPIKSTNVLSDKVNRALSVRTDTPAMRAALSALASLPSQSSSSSTDVNTTSSKSNNSSAVVTTTSHASSSSSSGGIIDAKSVRAAIETGALRQALQFQVELQKLARDATILRERVDTVSRVASHIGKIVDGSIISKDQIIDSSNSSGNNNGGDESGGGIATIIIDEDRSSWEMERALASTLHSAHKSYIDATQRQIAVDAFLDKFDLGEDEARLLDHYNFQGFILPEYNTDYDEDNNPWCHPSAALHINPNPSGEVLEDATRFLNAFERLVVIRKELSKTFGGGGGGDSSIANTSTTADESFDYDNIGQDNIGSGGQASSASSSGQLGTNSALRMMEQLANRQERAHERLYTFLQYFLGIGSATPTSHHNVPTSSNDAGRSFSISDASQFGALGRFQDGDDMDEAFGHPVVRKALRVLRHSPSHHVHILELIASSRRTEVTRRFLLALTSGYGGMAPLEMRAHDPVGYVGDMLAFAFRAFRVEGELVKTLFLCENTESNDPEERKHDGDEEFVGDNESDSKPMCAAEMLGQSMGGLARPLKTRLSQVIVSLASQGGISAGGGEAAHSSDDDDTSSSLNRLVAIYSVCGLLRFYYSAIEKAIEKAQEEGSTVKNENPLFSTCDECLIEAADCYVASLRAYSAMLETHSMGSSQTQAQLAQRVITLISEERVASPGFADDALALNSDEDDLVSNQLSLSFLVRTMVDATMSHLKTLNDTIALKSAVNVASKCGLETSESTKWTRLIDDREQTLVGELVGTEAETVLEVCGLGTIRSAIEDMNRVYIEGMTMASHSGLSAKEVEVAMKQFYSSLFSPPIPTFEDTIKDAELRKTARSRTAEIVIDEYQTVYDALNSERGGYADLSFLAHDPSQVKSLLSL